MAGFLGNGLISKGLGSDLMQKTMNAINGTVPAIPNQGAPMPSAPAYQQPEQTNWYSQANAIGAGNVPAAYAPVQDVQQKAAKTGQDVLDWSNEKHEKANPITQADTMKVEYDENGTPYEAEEQRQGTLLSGIVSGGNDTGKVKEGRAAAGFAQGQDPDLFMLPDNEKYDNSRNPIGMFLADILGINDLFGSARRNEAEKNAEWAWEYGGKQFSEDDVKNMEKTMVTTPSGRKASTEDFMNAKYYLPNGETYTQDELLNGSSYDETGEYIYTPQGSLVPAEDYDNARVMLGDGQLMDQDEYLRVKAADGTNDPDVKFDAAYMMPNGDLLTYDDMQSAEAGGKLERVQTGDMGPGNIGKVNPDAPWENIADTIPWIVDTAANSAPYFIPVYNALSTGARMYAAMNGYDPDTFDHRDYTFADKEMDNGQWVGAMAKPVVDYASEYLWGIKPGLNSSIKGNALTKTLKAAGQEGTEEVLAAPFETLQNNGLQGFGSDQVWDEGQNKMVNVDTDGWQRARNVADNAFQNFMGGALFGGALSGPTEAKKAIMKKMGKGEYSLPDSNVVTREEEEEIDRMFDRFKDRGEGE